MVASKTLLSLPQDVLLVVLRQEAIGARELCCLEMTCHELASLVDDTLWRGAFLMSRHCNALREPGNWKQEYARRASWSHEWRQHTSTSYHTPQLMRIGGQMAKTPEKLKRFALKVIGAQPPSPSVAAPRFPHATHVVDPAGAEVGCFATISEAVAHAAPYARVLVRPGYYCERLKLTRPVEIVGAGAVGSAVVVGIDAPTVEVRRAKRAAGGMVVLGRGSGEGGPGRGARSGGEVGWVGGCEVAEGWGEISLLPLMAGPATRPGSRASPASRADVRTDRVPACQPLPPPARPRLRRRDVRRGARQGGRRARARGVLHLERHGALRRHPGLGFVWLRAAQHGAQR